MICEDLVSANRIAWLPNDKGIIISDLDEKEANALKSGELIPNRSWTYDFTNGKKETLKLPKGHVVYDISSDGKTLLTSTFFMISNSGENTKSRAYLAPLDTLKPEMIVDSGFFGVRLSPDGNCVLGQKSIKRENSLGYDTTHQIMNLKTKKVHPLQPPEQALTLFEKMTFANNGKSVAFVWNEEILDPDNGQKWYRYNLSISNLSDESPKHKLIYQSKPEEYFAVFDWR